MSSENHSSSYGICTERGKNTDLFIVAECDTLCCMSVSLSKCTAAVSEAMPTD